jgi:hypothetical protein
MQMQRGIDIFGNPFFTHGSSFECAEQMTVLRWIQQGGDGEMEVASVITELIISSPQ